MQKLRSKLIVSVLSAGFALVGTQAKGDPPAPVPAVVTTVPGPCTTTSVPASLTGTLSSTGGSKQDPYVDLRSPVTGSEGLNCTHRFVVDVVNAMNPPPAPLQNWLTKFSVQGVYISVPQAQAACTALKLDSELWGERLGQWTKLHTDHQEGKWHAAGSCETPSIEHVISMPTKNFGFERYRVAATNGHIVRVQAQIVGPKPTLSHMQVVTQHGAARPNPDILYAGEPLRVNFVGNIDNHAGSDVCSYTVTTEHLSNKHKTESHFDRFMVQSMPTLAERGEYRIVAEATAKDALPHCQGKAEKVVNLHDARAAWITDVALTAGGVHFNAHDQGAYPQFCANCTSVFSPAHNIALLRITPVIQFGDGKTWCNYKIDQKFENDSRSHGGHYLKGPALPSGSHEEGTAGLTYSVKDSEFPPFLNRWNNNNNHVNVTIVGDAGDPTTPPCNVNAPGGHISKSITFTDNEKLPWATQ